MKMNQLARRIAFTLVLLTAVPMWVQAAESVRISGENLGRLDNVKGLASADLNARAEGIAQGLLGAAPGEVRAFRAHTDDMGMTHVRLHQYLNGKRVYGADSIVHARADGEIYLLNGNFTKPGNLSSRPELTADAALEIALKQLEVSKFELLSTAEISYAVGIESGAVQLAWRVLVEYGTETLARDYVFADATTGRVVAVSPTIHYAKNWRTHDSLDQEIIQGPVLCTNNQSCGDTAAQDAHDFAATTYDYYSVKFGRDSLDDSGMTMISNVHFGLNYNNAGWLSAPYNQMIYGDGNGSLFSPLSGDLDVVAHELTHGVTDFSSNLTYANASGALNEAWSDIMGASAEAWAEGGINADTWKLGEDIYTPGIAGDALRYMNDPTQDGYSTDHFDDRIPFVANPTDLNDWGGVHGNSGIANLAYYLLVEGGTHPQGKTSTVVTALGMDVAEQIFYRANNVYFTSSTDFQGASNHTAQAALDLYGTAERDQVLNAWCAVGVGSCAGGGGGGDVDAPIISNVDSQRIRRRRFSISWTTNEASDTVITFIGGASGTFSDNSLVTSHSMNFNGATAGTVYTYNVSSTDAAGNTATAGPFTHQQ
ncbi:MAG: M4 family metallopeptidase [Deltaproteobacteria bacterium]|nr:M4 family metallopeptidase [Deltaproteobacteria bacterium]